MKNLGQLRRTKAGNMALETIKARRVAVLMSFHTAGKVCDGPQQIVAAHAAMQRMPRDIVQEIIRIAGLQVLK